MFHTHSWEKHKWTFKEIVIPNLYFFLSAVEHKRYFEKCLQQKIQWKSMATVNCLVTDILQNIFFCVQQKKETHTGLEQVKGE